MTILRSVSALLGAAAVVYVASAQAPPALGPAAPPVASPFPAVSSVLTPATPLTAPISAPPSPIGIAAYPPPPGGPTLWSFLGLSYQQREYRQRQMARTPLGKVREKIQTPLSKLTKGIIPPFPPKTPSLAELQAPGPVGAAAKLKLDRAAAGERIKAVKELGTADCHYWPEAEDALVGALRNDRNEWVRLAAAETLAGGCCCTKKTITALTNAATCSNSDGAPAEKSPKVVAAAHAALNKCLKALCATMPMMAAPIEGGTVPTEQPKELPKDLPGVGMAAWSKPGPVAGEERSSGGLAPSAMAAKPTMEGYYERVATRPWQEIVAFASHGASRPPRIPAEYMLTSGGLDYAADPHENRRDRPLNLLDALLSDDEPAAAAPFAAPQPAPAARTPAAPVARTPAPAAPVTPSPAASLAAPKPRQAQPQPQAQRPAPRFTPPPAMPAPQVSQPEPAAAVEPAPVPASIATPRPLALPKGAQVVILLAGQTDPREVEREVQTLTAADLTATPAATGALLKAAEEMTDPAARSACVRAAARGPATPDTMASLERLVRDRSTEVRVEAATALQQMRAGK